MITEFLKITGEHYNDAEVIDRAARIIQDGGLVKEIKGSFTGVVGLPMELVKELVKQAEEVK